MQSNESRYSDHEAMLEDAIERVVDTQGLSYADARERVLGTSHGRRVIGSEAARRSTVVRPNPVHTELDFDWDGDSTSDSSTL